MQKKIVINALPYKSNSSGIGVLIRDLFGPLAAMTGRKCQVVLSQDAPEFPCGGDAERVTVPCDHKQGLRRVWFQNVRMGRRYGKDSVLLTTDSKLPFFLPKSCLPALLVTDLAVYRMPEVYKTSRVLLWKLQYRYARKRTALWLAISEFTRREMADVFGIPAEGIHVVHCACGEQMARVQEGPELAAVREKYGLDKPFVLFVGNTNPRKNLNRLMQAFDLAKEEGIAHQLIIAGEQGWKFDRAEALKGLKHGEDIRFIGFVPDEDMCALYSAAALFAFPTLYEGFGIPVLEAQSCGVPVLTSRCSSLPEVGGDAAVYADPYDVGSIRDGMLKLLSDTDYADALVQKGYKNVKRFSWQKSAVLLNEIIEREVQA